jgi:hypothetical protein
MQQRYLIEKKKTAAVQDQATAETFESKPGKDGRLHWHPIHSDRAETRPTSALMREIRHEINRALG